MERIEAASGYAESEGESDPFRKSSYSALDNCVEVGTGPAAGLPLGMVGVRDSKAGDEGPVLRFSQQEFGEFVIGVTRGEFGDGGKMSNVET